MLQLLLQYCRYHRVAGHSDKERKAFDEKFIRLDTRRLCELTSAADRWRLFTARFVMGALRPTVRSSRKRSCH